MTPLRIAAIGGTGLLVLFAASCRREVVSCEVGRYAISITVQDSVTLAFGPFTNVVATAVGSAHSDSSITQQILPATAGNGNIRDLQLGFQAPDTYVVSVIADGYQKWTKSDVSAPPDNVCSDRPVNQHVTAKLVKAP